MPRKLSTHKNPRFELISIEQFSHLAMTFWVGGTLTIGTIILPLLFKTLDEITAVSLTGQIFNINAYIGIVSLFLALIDILVHHRLTCLKLRRFWYVVVMEIVLIVNYFGIFPIIVRLRATLTDLTTHVIQHDSTFSIWHSVSSILFVITCVLGTLYILEKH